MKRESGVLMHISSLFGNYSSGSFGEEARYFIDFLSESGFGIWQVLPFCMPDECNSPYKSYSSFGGNPYFIDLPTLYEAGLLTAEELRGATQKSLYLCEYERLEKERVELLAKAASRIKDRSEILGFMKTHPRLDEAAKFLALREENGSRPWQEWTAFEPSLDRLFVWQFIEYVFYRQWQAVREYANSKGIKIIGDVPIYVALDSADVYFHKEDFQLDEKGYPLSVAGVPPDYFSEDGQLWGNPLYDWKRAEESGFSFWRERIAYMLELFDGVRIDHFRGFEAYFSIPAEAKSAKEGHWEAGPRERIVDAIKDVAGDSLIIAEDLGDITDEVRALLDYSGFPGMRVFQFAFLGDRETPHLPHNYDSNCIAYSGTHDNNTLLGYVFEMDESSRRDVFAYTGNTSGNFSDGVSAIKRTLLASSAPVVIFPIQDLFGYGADTRMNTPGVAKGNWAYRITREQLDALDRGELLRTNELFGRKN